MGANKGAIRRDLAADGKNLQQSIVVFKYGIVRDRGGGLWVAEKKEAFGECRITSPVDLKKCQSGVGNQRKVRFDAVEVGHGASFLQRFLQVSRDARLYMLRDNLRQSKRIECVFDDLRRGEIAQLLDQPESAGCIQEEHDTQEERNRRARCLVSMCTQSEKQRGN